jgi:hypothetical protein
MFTHVKSAAPEARTGFLPWRIRAWINQAPQSTQLKCLTDSERVRCQNELRPNRGGFGSESACGG